MSVKQTITCGYCHKSYQMPRSRPDARKFCSRACYFAHKRSTAFRPCRRCGKPVAKKTNLTYCSNACYGKKPRGESRNVNCERCGKTFSAHASKVDARFCSRRCHYDSAHAQCVRCGKIYKIGKWQASRSKQNFCSAECVKNRRTVDCIQCKKSMTLPVKEASFTRFCSKQCFALNKTTRVQVACLQCGATFTAPKCRQRTARFCSWTCKSRFKGETYIEQLTREALEKLSIPYIQEYEMSPFHIDFFLPLFSMAIEADGEPWHRGPKQQARDRRKDAMLAARGIGIIRLSGREIVKCKDLPKLIASRLHIKRKR